MLIMAKRKNETLAVCQEKKVCVKRIAVTILHDESVRLCLLARVSVQAFKVIFVSLGSCGAQWFIAKHAQSLVSTPAPRSKEACLFLCCSCCFIPLSWFSSFKCGQSLPCTSLVRLFFRSSEECYHRL